MDASEWDKRYREGFYSGHVDPHLFLQENCGLLPPGGRIVDIATGMGRDLLFLAERGYTVYGLDRSLEALKQACLLTEQKAVSFNPIQADALQLPLKRGVFDGVMVFYFLERDIMGELVSLLKPGGVLFYETFLKRQNDLDRHRNPAYLLDDGEISSFFRDLETLVYDEGVFTEGGKARAVARYIGRKR